MKDFFSYDLPAERIAQRPLPGDRAKARLLCVRRDKKAGQVKFRHQTFVDLPSILCPGDLLVFNSSRVLPARLFLDKESRDIGKGASGEILLVEKTEQDEDANQETWVALGKPMRKLSGGQVYRIGEELEVKVVGAVTDGRFIKIQLRGLGVNTVRKLLEKYGTMPIPPYIRGGKGDEQDVDDYQTVFAEQPGSIAAPTAGLHFTDGLLSQLTSKGIELADVALHVGPSSFLPVREENWDSHQVGLEKYTITKKSLSQVVRARTGGRRVIAVGTTVVRCLESLFKQYGGVEGVVKLDNLEEEIKGEAGIFITPGFSFQAVDALVTNFHQPRSTHLLLVAALIGSELLEKAYQTALEQNYRFLSYGDAMLLE